MVQDFGCVKDVMMREIHDSLDHGFMVYQKDQVLFEALTYSGQHWKIIATDFIPTAENLAKWCFDILRISFEVQLQYVEVWETPTSMARYPALVTL
jgi:6-pyruvoyl-tetrahydropterin synthase